MFGAVWYSGRSNWVFIHGRTNTKKLIWHSIRLLYFGIDIQRHGQLRDYTRANYLYEDLLAMKLHRWVDFRSKYIPIYNELTKEFICFTQNLPTSSNAIEL